MGRLSVSGCHVHVSPLCTGERKAFALHCSLASSRAWAPLAARMQGRLELFGMDLPGHGRSGDWDGQQDLHDLSTEMARAALPDGQVDLIGHSFGGTVALRLAAEMPGRVRSLTLIEPVFFAAASVEHPGAARRHDADMAAFADAMEREDREDAARAFLTVWGDGRPWDALPEAQRAACAARIHLIPAANDALFHDRQGLLEPGALSHVTSPVLLLEGSESHRIVPAINEALARRLPNVRRVVLSGAGHMLPITHSEQLAREMHALLSETVPAV